MHNNQIREKVSELIASTLSYNSTHSCKRFYPITTNRHGKLIEYGVYDYQTKKYVLHNSKARTLSSDLIEFEKFVEVVAQIGLYWGVLNIESPE